MMPKSLDFRGFQLSRIAPRRCGIASLGVIRGSRETMRRREFLGALAGVVAASPFAARAESGMRRVGVLLGNSENDPQGLAGMSEFRKGLQALDWTEGRNVQIDVR